MQMKTETNLDRKKNRNPVDWACNRASLTAILLLGFLGKQSTRSSVTFDSLSAFYLRSSAFIRGSSIYLMDAPR